MKKIFTIIMVAVAIFSATKFIETKGLVRSRIFGAADVYTDNQSFVSTDINALANTSILFYAATLVLEKVMETETDTDAIVEATGETVDVYVTAAELAAGAAEIAAEAAAAAAAVVGGLISKETYRANINASIAMAALD